MTQMFYDSIDSVDKPRLTTDGYLVAEVPVARTGIQNYLARELGLDGEPNRMIRVFRPESEVFAADAMASYAFRPVTVDHPGSMVDAENWKEHSRGSTGGEVMRDGDVVRVPMTLMDANAIREWEAGKRELSMGYSMTLDMTSGVTDSGEEYDAVQRDLRMNHLALVTRARGGSKLRLGDGTLEDSKMDLKTVTVDGLAVETTEQGAQAIAKLQQDVADADQKLTDANTAHAAEIAAKDTEIATKDAEIDDLNGKILSDSDLDEQVTVRGDLIAAAKLVADKDYTGKSAEEIRKIAVSAHVGDEEIADKSADYIEARFDLLVKDAGGKEKVRDSIRNNGLGTQTDAAKSRDEAYDGMRKRTEDAWKGNNKEVH